MPGLRVLCDFDGTISTVDVTDALLEAFALPAWRDLEVAWKAGRIGSRECMKRQVELLRCGRAELDSFLDTIQIDPAFPAFAAYCEEFGIPLSILSDGIDYVIHTILCRNGFDEIPVFANRLVFSGGDRMRLESPHLVASCASASGICKCALVERAARNAGGTLLIGDGVSDFCAARAADMVFAKDRLLSSCGEHDLPHMEFGNFHDALEMLRDAEMSGEWRVRPLRKETVNK